MSKLLLCDNQAGSGGVIVVLHQMYFMSKLLLCDNQVGSGGVIVVLHQMNIFFRYRCKKMFSMI
jgi:hypothetical protein